MILVRSRVRRARDETAPGDQSAETGNATDHLAGERSSSKSIARSSVLSHSCFRDHGHLENNHSSGAGRTAAGSEKGSPFW